MSSTAPYSPITLVGTVHISTQSRDRVISTIEAETPDVVTIELDAGRYQQLATATDRDPGLLGTLEAVISGDRSATAAALNYALSKHYKKIYANIDLQPGEADMLPAVRTAHEIGSTVALVDETAETIFNSMGDALTVENVISSFLSADIVEFATEYETCADIVERHNLGDVETPEDAIDALEVIPYSELDRLLTAYATILPDGLVHNFLTERNNRMAGHIQWLRQQDQSVVAVMGRAHVPGVQALLDAPERIPSHRITEPAYIPAP